MPIRTIVLTALLVVGHGNAHADAPGATTSDLPVGAYPTNVADRPLVLPRGVAELGARLRTFRATNEGDTFYETFDYINADLVARVGVGPLELFGEADLLLATPEFVDDAEPIASVAGGARIRVQRDQHVEVRVGMWNPSEERSTLDASAVYLARRKTARDVAFFGGGGARYNRAFGDSVGDQNRSVVAAEGRMGAMVHIAPQYAADFDVLLSIPLVDDYEDFDPPTSTEVGARFLVVSQHVDGYIGARFRSTGDVGIRTLLIGVAGRLR